jgi:hypothetical protein
MEKKEREEIKKEFHLLIKEFCLVSRRAVTEAEVLWPHKLRTLDNVEFGGKCVEISRDRLPERALVVYLTTRYK